MPLVPIAFSSLLRLAGGITAHIATFPGGQGEGSKLHPVILVCFVMPVFGLYFDSLEAWLDVLRGALSLRSLWRDALSQTPCSYSVLAFRNPQCICCIPETFPETFQSPSRDVLQSASFRTLHSSSTLPDPFPCLTVFSWLWCCPSGQGSRQTWLLRLRILWTANAGLKIC